MNINEFYCYCSNCGKRFNIIKNNHLCKHSRYCSEECEEEFSSALEKLSRARVKERAKRLIPDTYKGIKEPTDRDKVVSLSKGFNSVRRSSITYSLKEAGVEPVKVKFKKKRIDGETRTYSSNGFKLGDIYDAIQKKHKMYKDTANFSFKYSRDYIVDVYRVLSKC